MQSEKKKAPTATDSSAKKGKKDASSGKGKLFDKSKLRSNTDRSHLGPASKSNRNPSSRLFATGSGKDPTKKVGGTGAAAEGKPSGTRDLSKIRCYNCNQFGHYAKDCPHPRRQRAPIGGRLASFVGRLQDTFQEGALSPELLTGFECMVCDA